MVRGNPVISSASAYNPYQVQNAPVRPPERAAEPARVNPAEPIKRPVNQIEPARRESTDNRRSAERLEGETQAADNNQLDPLIELFIERTEQNGQNRQAPDGQNAESQQGQQSSGELIEYNTEAGSNSPAATSQTEPSGSSTLGFSDLRSALSYWESLNPEREDTSNLPAPIAAYREVESGPAPTLGLSTYA